MNKRRMLAAGLATLALAGCNSDVITTPESPSRPLRDGGAYLGAGFNVQPAPNTTTATDSSAQRGGAYLGAGF